MSGYDGGTRGSGQDRLKQCFRFLNTMTTYDDDFVKSETRKVTEYKRINVIEVVFTLSSDEGSRPKYGVFWCTDVVDLELYYTCDSYISCRSS